MNEIKGDRKGNHPGLKLTILIDNNTLTQIDADLRGEPGLCFYIECGQTKILFDTGYSGLFIENARKMRINLHNLNHIVLSHGHLDHTWGLVSLIQLHNTWATLKLPFKRPSLIAHPDVFLPKTVNEKSQAGSLLNQEEISNRMDVRLSKSPVWIGRQLVFLGEIERSNDFEGLKARGKVKRGGKWVDDYLVDDSALVFTSPGGLVIITGCSHSGICNIIQYAKKVCKEDRVIDIVGGFHLINPAKKQLTRTLDYFQKLNPNAVHASHCTDLNSKIALSKAVKVSDVGVGLTLKY